MNNPRQRRLAAAVSGAALALLATGCGREIDESAVSATLVPGSNGIYRFCDGPTLIYFTDRDGEDEIEAIWPDMCEPDEGGNWVYSTDPEEYAEPTTARKNGNVPDDGN